MMGKVLPLKGAHHPTAQSGIICSVDLSWVHGPPQFAQLRGLLDVNRRGVEQAISAGTREYIRLSSEALNSGHVPPAMWDS